MGSTRPQTEWRFFQGPELRDIIGRLNKDEPGEVKFKEGSTLVWGVKRAIEGAGMVPDIIHDAGDIGKEPIIRVLGHDPLEVVDKALRLAGFS